MGSRLCRDDVLLGKGRVATEDEGVHHRGTRGGQPRKNKIDPASDKERGA